MSKKLKNKIIRALLIYPWSLMILANGWYKAIGAVAMLYIIVSAVCTWIDEAKERSEI